MPILFLSNSYVLVEKNKASSDYIIENSRTCTQNIVLLIKIMVFHGVKVVFSVVNAFLAAVAERLDGEERLAH